MKLFRRFNRENARTEPKKKQQLSWIPLTSLDQLLQIKEQSKTIPVIIFKHSTRCVISRMVLREFESSFAEHQLSVSLYILDLLTYRDISNEIGSEFDVFHQSPQLIIIKNGEAIYHASHNDINSKSIKEFV
jgi:bacillithiol system protein YtxJ